MRDYITFTGATYPVLRNGSLTRSQYGIAYDNYVVVDPAGIVRYTSVNEAFGSAGRWNGTSVRAAIDAHLPAPAAVTDASWSGVKALYSAP